MLLLDIVAETVASAAGITVGFAIHANRMRKHLEELHDDFLRSTFRRFELKETGDEPTAVVVLPHQARLR